MNPLAYLRKNGIKRALDVIYQYKLDHVLVKLMKPFFKKTPLKDTIIIESHNDFDCNGGAFYDYLLEHGLNEKYKIVWLLKNKKPKELPRNVIALYRHKPSIRKAYHVCTAKYLLADNTVTDKVRDDQLSIYCSHGAVAIKNCTGLCTLPSSVDFVLFPSENFAPMVAKQWNFPYPSERALHIGYPCMDVMFRDIPDEFEKITTETFSKRVLWMPTFRKGGGYNRSDSDHELPLGVPLIESQEDFDRLDAFLAQQDILLVIKLHPMQDPSTYAALRETHNIRVLTGEDVKRLDIDNYRLMLCADALLSDYSSSAFQFLMLDRPIGFVLSDLGDYKLGLCVDNADDYLVGHRIFTYADLERFFCDLTAGNDEYVQQRQRLRGWLYTYQDGNSCQRLAEFMGV